MSTLGFVLELELPATLLASGRGTEGAQPEQDCSRWIKLELWRHVIAACFSLLEMA